MSEDGEREQPERAERGIPAPRVKAIGALTIVGVMMFVVILITVDDPDGMLWFFGGLMLLAAAAFWVTYFLDWKRRKG